MVKSMTAYHAIQCQTAFGGMALELHAVNRKHLEINTSLPKEWTFLDPEIKKWIGERVERGHVSFRLSVSYDESFEGISLKCNKPLFKSLLLAFKELSQEAAIPFQEGFNLTEVVNTFQLVKVEEKKEETLYRQSLKEVFSQLIEPFITVKEDEGFALAKELLTYVEKINEILESIKEKEPFFKRNLESRWKIKLKELQESFEEKELEEKVLREVAFWLEKGDITEERVRILHHLETMKKVLKGEEKGACGKKIEFLLQEIQREVNTMGSKSHEIELSTFTIEIKGLLEKMREQAYNIE